MTDTRVLFAGTPEFALASLQALTNSGITPLAPGEASASPRAR
jgi:methionyl-tRNA formyltransferase